MPNPKPLTERETLAINERLAAGTFTAQDLAALLQHAEVMADMLSDCWLALDELARTNWQDVGGLKQNAALLLTRQRAPGWKGPTT